MKFSHNKKKKGKNWITLDNFDYTHPLLVSIKQATKDKENPISVHFSLIPSLSSRSSVTKGKNTGTKQKDTGNGISFSDFARPSEQEMNEKFLVKIK